MVANTTISDASQVPYRQLSAIKMNGPATLNNIRTGAYALSIDSLGDLRRMEAFKEMRIKCFKPCFGKRLDIAFQNPSHIDEYVRVLPSSNSVIQESIDFRFLADDEYGTFYEGYTFKKYVRDFYDHPIYISNIGAVGITNPTRMECGDYVSYSSHELPSYTYDPIGQWRYYIR